MEDDLTQVTRVVKVPKGDGVLRPVRPVRDWLAFGQADGGSPPPHQVVGVLLAALHAINEHGSPVLADAIWIDPDGQIELVLPSRGGCSEAECLLSLGCLAAEALSGSPSDSAGPRDRLARARAQALACYPHEWTMPLEFALGRLLGLAPPFGSIRNALDAMERLASQESFGLQQFHGYGFPAGPHIPLPAPKSPRWVIPAAAGFAVASLLGLGAWFTYRLGQSHAPVPIVPAQPAAAVLPAGHIVLDSTGLIALAKALRDPAAPHLPTSSGQPSMGAKTKAAPAKPGQEVDDGPVYVGGSGPPSSPRRQDVDPNRVTKSDFVARR